jgi:molybdopterin/thiamine biosynthesis adenylyltransferase/rhodanese-related sulfurtransferase
MASFRDLLRETKSRIREVDTGAAAEEVAKPGTVVLDVREPDEYEQGALPGALHIPRGHLEGQVESRITDHDANIVVYCAGGTRSAFAAETLGQLGYRNVVSLAGGFNKWKDEGRPWKTPATLTADQRNRYQRHLLLPEVDVAGQARLLQSRVLLLGAGGLGSPAAMYLAAAGVGTLGVIDMDVVDESNLQRQILHNMDRVGERKVDSAKKTLTALNPDVNVVTYDVRLGADNVLDIFSGYDLVVDGTDNFPTRYLVNDASLKLDIPVVHGSIFRFEGQVSVYLPHEGPCYRCQVPEPPPAELAPSCAEAGVLGVLPGIIGSIQAMEAIKVLLGIGEPLAGRLLAYDALEGTFRTFRVPRDPGCAACSIPKEQLAIAEYDDLCMPHPVQPPAG